MATTKLYDLSIYSVIHPIRGSIMDSKVFKQMLSPFGLIIGGSIATIFLLVEKQLEKMGILYLSGHQNVNLFIGIALSTWFILFLKNFYDYKINGRTDFDHSDNSLSTDKCKAMYPAIPSRYLSKKPNDFTLGKYHHKYFRFPIDLNDITHCLVIGAPGSFKSSTLLNALIWNFNFAKEKDKFTVFAMDVKPELARKSVDMNSNQCHVFNPSLKEGWGWDVWYGLDSTTSTDDEIIERADMLARAIIVNPNNGQNEFFYVSAQNLLTCFLGWGFVNGLGFTETIIQVLSVPLKDLISTVTFDPNMDGHDSIKDPLRGYDDKTSDGMQDIELTMRQELRIFQTRSVRYQLDENHRKASPADLVNGISVFLAIPDNLLKQYSAIFRLITQQVLNFLSSIPEEERADHDAPLIWMLIDEFGSIGKIPDILDALARLRSRKVSIWLAVQGLSQLDMAYGHDGSRAIVDNTETTLVFSCKDKSTVDIISSWCGQYLETKISKNKKPGRILGGSQSLSESGEYRNVMDAVDIMGLRKNKELLVFDSGNRFLIQKCPYWAIPLLKKKSNEIKNKNRPDWR